MRYHGITWESHCNTASFLKAATSKMSKQDMRKRYTTV
jgi:hypothetical protein